jgi:hypothetical protein
LYSIFNSNAIGLKEIVSVFGVFIGLLTVLIMFFRSPVRAIRSPLKVLTKVNIIYLSYIRQMKQIDTTYKLKISAPGIIRYETLDEINNYIQQTTQQTLEDITDALEELED